MLNDQKYLGMLSSRLRNYSKKDSRLYNFSCPLCGDSTTDKKKARAYCMPKKKGSGLYFFCHKCNEAMPFGLFLKRIDNLLYKEYQRERIGSRYSNKPKEIDPPKFTAMKKTLVTASIKFDVYDDLQNMSEMPKNIAGYLIDRKIPLDKLWKYFYFADDFKKVANQICSNTFSSAALKYKESRIVLTMLDASGNIIGIQGRTITESSAKYITIKRSDSARKIFGLDQIKYNRPVVVLEGPIDSCFIDNSIGVCGADLVSQVEGLNIDPIFCFDNEPYSTIIAKKVFKAINQGYKVVIYPKSIKQKDINDMVLSGIDVNKLIKERTFSGLRARAEFNQWSRRAI